MPRTWRMPLAAMLLAGLLATSAWATVKVQLTLFVDGLVHPLAMLTAPDGTKRRCGAERHHRGADARRDTTTSAVSGPDEKIVRLNRLRLEPHGRHALLQSR